MSLIVNYACSDDSDENDESTCDFPTIKSNASIKETINNTSQFNDISDSDTENIDVEAHNSRNEIQQDHTFLDIFSKLPAPIDDTDIAEPELIILPSKSEMELREKPPQKKKIFINLPTISNSDSESDNEAGPCTKRIKNMGKCDLFNLLPAPKSSSTKEHNRSLVPHAVSNKISATSKHSLITTTKSTKKLKLGNSDSEAKLENTVALSIPSPEHHSDSDNEVESKDFFSIDRCIDNNSTDVNLPLLYNSITSGRTVNIGNNSSKMDATNALLLNLDYLNERGNVVGLAADDYSNEFQLNTNLSDALIGPTMDTSVNYAQKMDLEPPREFDPPPREFADFENSEIIEARIDDWMSGYELQKVKDLTREENHVSFSKKHKHMPTSQQKRKHQITFLAYEAKERELELKNQWAESRFTKKQCQNKYGF